MRLCLVTTRCSHRRKDPGAQQFPPDFGSSPAGKYLSVVCHMATEMITSRYQGGRRFDAVRATRDRDTAAGTTHERIHRLSEGGLRSQRKVLLPGVALVRGHGPDRRLGDLPGPDDPEFDRACQWRMDSDLLSAGGFRVFVAPPGKEWFSAMGRRGCKRRIPVLRSLRELLSAGGGTVDACGQLGVGRRSDFRWRHENGVPPTSWPRLSTPADICLASSVSGSPRWPSDGHSVREIVRRSVRSPSTISREMRRNRAPRDRGGYEEPSDHAHLGPSSNDVWFGFVKADSSQRRNTEVCGGCDGRGCWEGSRLGVDG